MSTGKAIVIGSGFGGLAAAVRLAARGYDVEVLEKLDKPGGRAYQFEQDGYTFDAGPTVITAPELLEDLWKLCGKHLKDDIHLKRVSPLYRLRFDDGTILNYTEDAGEMVEQLRVIAPGDVAGYKRFMERSQETFRIGFEELAHVPFGSFFDMIKVLPDMVRLGSFRSVYDAVCGYVQDERLRQMMSFHTLLVGGNPFSTSAIYAMIPFLERKWGVHFPMGGIGALIRGMVGLVESKGGRVRCNAEVKRILLDGRKAVGVELAGDERIEADVVVSNADVGWTYSKLLAPEARRRWTDRKIEKARYSMSVFVWYFGTTKSYDDVAQHTIVFGPRYRGLLDDIFDRKVLASDFSLYVHRSTASDPSLAPEGCESFYALSPVPHLESGIDWEEQKEAYRLAIEERLAATILPGLPENIATQRMITPTYFRDELLSPHGAAFSLQPVLTQSAYFRPHNKSEDIEGLYIVGAGTHPGAGIPGVLSSARVLDAVVPDPVRPN